jgi:hypothetical protein
MMPSRHAGPNRIFKQMYCLSILRDGRVVTVVASPILPLAPFSIRHGAEIRFQVFEADADELKSLVGEHRCFYIDETSGLFWARLKCLEPCVNTYPELDKPTLCGVLAVVAEPLASPQ